MVAGTVVDPRGNPIPGAVVHDVGGFGEPVTSGGLGEFAWPEPEAPIELTATEETVHSGPEKKDATASS